MGGRASPSQPFTEEMGAHVLWCKGLRRDLNLSSGVRCLEFHHQGQALGFGIALFPNMFCFVFKLLLQEGEGR